MTDEEINRITFEQWGPVIDVPPAAHRAFARAIIAAHTEKLLAGVEMPPRFPAGYTSIRPFAHYDDAVQYAAAAALNARNKALEEAKLEAVKRHNAGEAGGVLISAAIEQLKGKV